MRRIIRKRRAVKRSGEERELLKPKNVPHTLYEMYIATVKAFKKRELADENLARILQGYLRGMLREERGESGNAGRTDFIRIFGGMQFHKPSRGKSTGRSSKTNRDPLRDNEANPATEEGIRSGSGSASGNEGAADRVEHEQVSGARMTKEKPRNMNCSRYSFRRSTTDNRKPSGQRSTPGSTVEAALTVETCNQDSAGKNGTLIRPDELVVNKSTRDVGELDRTKLAEHSRECENAERTGGMKKGQRRKRNTTYKTRSMQK